MNNLVLGTLPFGSVVTHADSAEIINLAWKNGINNFDVATLYGNGNAAEILGTSLGKNRHSAKIWLSIGLEKVSDPKGVFAVNVMKLSSEYLEKSILEMLEKMSINSVEVLNIHGPDPTTSWEEVLKSLRRLQSKKLFSRLSISNFSSLDLDQILELEKALDFGFDIFQFHGNLIEQRLINKYKYKLIKNQKQIFCFRPLARGLLTREYSTKDNRPPQSRSTRGWRLDSYLQPQILIKLEEFRNIAKKYNYEPTQLALYWLLNISGVQGAILGVRTTQQLIQIRDLRNFSPNTKCLDEILRFTNDSEFIKISSNLPLDDFEK